MLHSASVLAAHLGFTRTLALHGSHFRDTLSSWLFLNILKFLFILPGFYFENQNLSTTSLGKENVNVFDKVDSSEPEGHIYLESRG